MEYVFKNCSKIKTLKIITECNISNFLIKKLCANLSTLRMISIITKRNSLKQYLFKDELYERNIIVRRPKSNEFDRNLTKEGTIKKYSDFYTQEVPKFNKYDEIP